MKKILLFLTIPVIAISCNEAEKEAPNIQSTKTKEVNKDSTSTEVTHSAAEPNRDYIIDDTTTVLDLDYGNLANYTTDLHPSIGEEVNIHIEDTTLFNITSTEFEYDSKERPIEPGGDSGQKTFHFEALNPGETSMTITKVYRGEVKQEQKISIIVRRLQKAGGDLKE